MFIIGGENGCKLPTNSVYKVSDNGLTITASEVYCDGYSVYLSLNVDSKKSLGKMCSFYTSSYGKAMSQFFYTWGTYQIGDHDKEIQLMNDHIEGKQTSDNSFKGIMKLNLKNLREKEESFDLKLKLKGLGAETEDSIKNLNDISISGLTTNGTWTFTIPIRVDILSVKTYKITDKNAEGYGINNVVVTPYQIIVDAFAPSRKSFTEEEIKELFAAKNRKLNKAGKKPVEYEDFKAQIDVQKEFWVTIFDQNGDRIEWENGYNNKMQNFAVKGKDLKKLYIYIGTDTIDTFKETNQKRMEAKAVYKTEVDLTK